MEPGARPPPAMTDTQRISSERLVLRRWRASDREAFAALNTEPRVLEFLPGALSRAESDALITRIEAHIDEHGFGFWAAEIPGVAACAGFVGLAVPRFDAHFTPCVEIGWRLAPEVWGKGYATEGARAVLDFAFDELGLEEVVSYTAPLNSASRRVMEKLGMTHDPAQDFDHPLLPAGDPLRRMVLYRVTSDRSPA